VIHVDADWLRSHRNWSPGTANWTDTSTALPAKVFTRDGGIHLFPDGFSIGEDAIQGRGTSYTLGSEQGDPGASIPLDSIIVVGYQKKTHTTGELLGSFMMATWLTSIITISVGLAILMITGFNFTG